MPRACVLLLASLTLVTPSFAQQNPLGKGGGQNPLAKPPAWAGTWSDGEVTLTLEARGGAVAGELSVGGGRFPVQGTALEGQPGVLGGFQVEGSEFPLRAVLEGEVLVMTSEGNTYRLTRQGPKNPLAGGPAVPDASPAPDPRGSPPPAPPAAAPELGQVDAGPVTPYKNANGWLTLELPQGWTVQGEDPEGILLNPGLVQGGTMDAIVLVRFGELDPGERGQPPAALMAQALPALQQELEGQGISSKGSGQARSLQVAGQPGAVLQYPAANQAGLALQVWLGLVVNGPRYALVMGVLDQSKAARFQPKLGRLLLGVRVGAGGAATGEGAAAPSLAGMEFSSGNGAGAGGAFYTIYGFPDAGTVTRQHLASGRLGGADVGGDSQDSGRYLLQGTTLTVEVAGERLTGRVLLEGGQVKGIELGGSVYTRRR